MSQDRPVVTRFAPSPTGYLHIGGARTALFNWLYARGRNGRFLLRIEDTDRERSTEAAVDAIFQGLDWLGLAADAPPVFQHARADRHREVASLLLEKGRAYRDFLSPEETAALRDASHAQGQAFRSPWRDRTDGPAHLPHVVRFKGPVDGDTVVPDRVQGEVRWANKDLDDLILLRSDGGPTYNLAVVVDDHDMGVTHVIRGDDHLNNAARQSLIYAAMEWETPVFAHVPLIHGPDGAKLSKRHGAQAVGDFEDMGYLPEAVRNYLVRLGWGHGDDEVFSDAQARTWFDIDDVGRAPARLDWDKLNFINAYWMRQAGIDRLSDLAVGLARKADPSFSRAAEEMLRRAAPLVSERARTVLDLIELTAFARAQRPLSLDEKALARLDEEARRRLAVLARRLSETPDWRASALEAVLKSFAEEQGIGLGKIGPGLRAALAGPHAAPDLGKTLEALGRDESLGRISDALSTGG